MKFLSVYQGLPHEFVKDDIRVFLRAHHPHDGVEAREDLEDGLAIILLDTVKVGKIQNHKVLYDIGIMNSVVFAV